VKCCRRSDSCCDCDIAARLLTGRAEHGCGVRSGVPVAHPWLQLPGPDQENNEGNPIRYERSTQNDQWDKRVQRYNAWKDYVRLALIDAAPRCICTGVAYQVRPEKNPIDLGKSSASMNLKIHVAKRNHCDPDNLSKGLRRLCFRIIAKVAGCFSYDNAPEKKGSVEVTDRDQLLNVSPFSLAILFIAFTNECV